jgi:hypothetical protein
MRIAASAAVGGTSSVLTGGKFVNGAVTAAFARMFNDELHFKEAAICGGAAAGAAGVCIGAGAATVSCPVTGASCVIAPPAASACLGAAAAALAVCSVATGSAYRSGARVYGNSADSMIGTEVYYLINNTTDEIDKIGITSYPNTRYLKPYLDDQNVRYETQARYIWRYFAVVDERIRLLNYWSEHGHLPRLNKTLR